MTKLILLSLLSIPGRTYVVEGRPIEAEFIQFSDNMVLLETQDGYLYLHPSQLSSADRKHYQNVLRQYYQSKLDARTEFAQKYRIFRANSREIRRQNEYSTAQRRLDWSLNRKRWDFERIYLWRYRQWR